MMGLKLNQSTMYIQASIYINSLTPKKYGGNFQCIILQHILMTAILSISSKIALGYIPHDFTDDKSTLV